MANPRVIKLLGQPIQNEDSKAAEVITPGHLVTFDGSGNLIKHNSAATKAAPAFALEREEMGLGIDDDYAVNDYVKVGVFHQGCRVNAILTSGQTVAKGALLVSNGDGTLKAGTTAGMVVGRALVAVTTTSAVARVDCEII